MQIKDRKFSFFFFLFNYKEDSLIIFLISDKYNLLNI